MEPMYPASELDFVVETYNEFKRKDLGCVSSCAPSPVRINTGHVHFSDSAIDGGLLAYLALLAQQGRMSRNEGSLPECRSKAWSGGDLRHSSSQ